MNLADYDFSYLIPPQEVFDVHHDGMLSISPCHKALEHYIQHGEGVKSIRKIFDCVPYTEFEKQKLAEFEAIIKKEGIQLPPGWRTAYTMKFVYSAKFTLDKCLENLKQYLTWLNHPNRRTVPAKSLELLKEGIIYLAGRDKQYRPVIVANVDRIDLKKMTMEDFTEALCCLCYVLEKHCFVPGKVENWIIIIETNNASVWNFPFKILQNLVAVTSISFTSTLDKLYLMNPSRLLKGSWSLIQKLLHPETAAKIAMIDKSEYKALQEKISNDQIEEKYGGTLSNSTVYWPPRNTLNKTPYRRPEDDPTRDPRKGLEVDTRVGKDVDLKSGVLRSAISGDRMLNNSVYYDFDTVYADYPDENRALRNPSLSDNFAKRPAQDKNLVLEGNVKDTGCCGMRRGSGKSDSCSMF